MWLTILKDMQLQYLLQAMPNFYLDRKSSIPIWNNKATHFNEVGA
jgi:hypothetical protein